jgi:predicted nuclease of predicted toxin-antitoxin system
MTVTFYMDQHVPRAITIGLRRRGIDVLTAYEDGASEFDDPTLLDRASALNCVLFTQDEDLLAEATQRQRIGMPFRGVVYAHQLEVSIGDCIRDLELIAQAGEAGEFENMVQYLPL